jgi:hypothetical protein
MVMRSRKCAGILVLVAAAVLIAAGTRCYSEPVLIYSEDWNNGTGGWSNSQSMYPGRAPKRRDVGHPMVNYAMFFYGGCGWGLNMAPAPAVPLWINTTIYPLGSDRNCFSVNMRGAGGGQIYKYGLGGGGVIIANKQPPAMYMRETELRYKTNVPYELYSIWLPGTARYAIGLKNLLTGEDRISRTLWRCRSNDVPSLIDLDQEGGRGPVALLKVEVYLGQ